jgi:hypothetical protein
MSEDITALVPMVNNIEDRNAEEMEKMKSTIEKRGQLRLAKSLIFRNPTTTTEIVGAIRALVKVAELERDFNV